MRAMLSILALLLILGAAACDDAEPDEAANQAHGDEAVDAPEVSDDVSDDNGADVDEDPDDAEDGGDAPDPDDASRDDAPADNGLPNVPDAPQPVRVTYDGDPGDTQGPSRVTIALEGSTFVYSQIAAMDMVLWQKTSPERVVDCMELRDPDPEWGCSELPSAEGFYELAPDRELPSHPSYFLDSAFVEGEFDDPRVEEIAGREAVCGDAPEHDGFAAGEVCVDTATGVILRMDHRTHEGGTAHLEAVEVAPPTDDDFTPPAEPIPGT